MRVGVTKDYKLKQRNLRASHTLVNNSRLTQSSLKKREKSSLLQQNKKKAEAEGKNCHGLVSFSPFSPQIR